MRNRDRYRYRGDDRTYDRYYERHGHHRWNHPFHGLWRGFMLLVVGCILIAIGMSLGGRWNNIPAIPGLSGKGFPFIWNDRDKKGTGSESIRDIEEKSGEIRGGVHHLVIRVKTASLVVRTGSAGSWSASDFDRNSLRAEQDNDSFTIEEREWQRLFTPENGFPKPSIEIVLPEGVTLESVRITMGAGSTTLESVKTGELDIENGAGSVKGREITAKKASISAGAGAIEFIDSDFGDSDIETGAGRFVFSGSIGRHTGVSTGAGAVEMDVGGNVNEYRIDYKRGIGSVRIDGESFTGMGEGSTGNRTAEKNIKISSGVGSVRIDFSDKTN